MSACNRPSYTNYVGGFHGCLDYIFFQPESMQVWTLAVLTLEILVEFLFNHFIHSKMGPLLWWPGLLEYSNIVACLNICHVVFLFAHSE